RDRPRPVRARRDARDVRGRTRARPLAPERRLALRDPRAVRDVRRCDDPGPDRPGGLRGRKPEGRRAWRTGGSECAAAQPPSRGSPGSARGGVRRAADPFLPGTADPGRLKTELLESWPSGRRHLTRNQAYRQRYRRFESYALRSLERWPSG